ncbi:MAG: hypothetical protein R3F51_13280 [Cyanobacteriota/Melainabacteria group bacterium]
MNDRRPIYFKSPKCHHRRTRASGHNPEIDCAVKDNVKLERHLFPSTASTKSDRRLDNRERPSVSPEITS